MGTILARSEWFMGFLKTHTHTKKQFASGTTDGNMRPFRDFYNRENQNKAISETCDFSLSRF